MRTRFLFAAALIAAFVGASLAQLGSTPQPPRERLSLDPGWRFHLGDVPFPEIKGHEDTYGNAKAGKAWGAAAPEFDDSTWRELDLPHDWAVEGPFDPNANVSQGYRPRGVGWYRRALRLDPADRGKHLELQFDAIATHATIWFNGTIVQRSFSGYTASNIDITPFAKYGDELNSIAIRVDAVPMEGWWYEGAGIYRHAWLVKRDPVHIVTDGVYAHPRRQQDGTWLIPAEVTLNNSGKETADVEVQVELSDPRGERVVAASGSARVEPLASSVVRVSLKVDSPRLWSIEDPVLYQVRTAVTRGGKTVDGVVTPAGFRYFRFDADRGFFLNDQPVKIQGVCLHQDHGGVGTAMPDSMWEYRLRRLKELGANALRCSHNAPAPELLDVADRLGILIMDENRNFNVSPEYMRQLEWLIRRDRNHPSIILWSVFNEEPMQGSEIGYEMVRRMSATVKRLDDTRPVTAAMNNGMFAPVNVSQAVDVVGFNYQIKEYDRFHSAHPKIPMMSSEDTSAFMTRGEFTTDKSKNIMASYDDEAAPWGATHRNAWQAIASRPFMAGGFVWTGFDYHGEPTPFTWPTASSFFGIMDLCGFPKTAYWLHQAQWKTEPVLQLVPHWNWAGREGEPIKVMALSNADTVALSLNGKLISEQKVDPYEMVSWQVPYAPGRLEAVGRKDGKIIARTTVETTGAAVRLRLSADRPRIAGDGWDAMPVTVQAVDSKGRPVPTANLPVDFEIAGGRIIGLCNGDPNSHEPEKGARRSLFNGYAQVIVQSLPQGAETTLALRASGAGVQPAQTKVRIDAVPPRPAVERTPSVIRKSSHAD
jgi:beta-galactosidase